MAKFCERLKELRIERKLTQQEMADKMEVNRVTYTNWENDKREPRLDQIVELSTNLNATVDYLTGKEDTNALDILPNDVEKMTDDEKQDLEKQMMKNLSTILQADQEKFSLSDKDLKFVFNNICGKD